MKYDPIVDMRRLAALVEKIQDELLGAAIVQRDLWPRVEPWLHGDFMAPMSSVGSGARHDRRDIVEAIKVLEEIGATKNDGLAPIESFLRRTRAPGALHAIQIAQHITSADEGWTPTRFVDEGIKRLERIFQPW